MKQFQLTDPKDNMTVALFWCREYNTARCIAYELAKELRSDLEMYEISDLHACHCELIFGGK